MYLGIVELQNKKYVCISGEFVQKCIHILKNKQVPILVQTAYIIPDLPGFPGCHPKAPESPFHISALRH